MKTDVPVRSLAIAASLLFLLFAGFAFWLAVQEESRTDWVRHTVEVELHLADLEALARDAESGERGYVATGDETYLTPWRRTHGHFAGMFNTLAAMVRDNPTQQWALAAVLAPLHAKFAEIAGAIRLQEAGDGAGAHALLASGRGLALMANIHARLGAMRGEEERLLVERTQRVTWARGMLPADVALAGLCALIGIALWMRAVRSAARALETSNLEMRKANLSLDEGNRQLLVEMKRREVAEGQLHQAQKMEVIGQLTGGIAHDFNNRLLGVSGCLELLLHRSANNATGCGVPEIQRYAGQALKEAKRAAELTRNLLAFSRQQALSPEAVAPNRLVFNMSALLERTLGGQVSVGTVLPSGLWDVRIDRNQLENAVLNLAVNARDAMGTAGGHLTIETANVEFDATQAHLGLSPGQYVLIAVSDTGTGMDTETARKAIEPFFTTKSVGQGTGLGLSQVYGFIKQSGGHLKIYSEVGRGTTVKLYLPRCSPSCSPSRSPSCSDDGARPLAAMPGEAAPQVAQGRPVVLVVDDETVVRQFSVEALATLGYGVLEAADAASGLALLDAHPEVALLFTDVVMPGMDGGRLAREAARRRPGLAVLFATGHTRGAITAQGMLEPGVELLNKPFGLVELGRKVRQVLDRTDAPLAA